MSDYDFRPGGSLKLKSGDGKLGKKKRKKDKSAKELKTLEDDAAASMAVALRKEGDKGESSSSRRSPLVEDGKTEAERRFEKVQKRRLEKRVQKLAAQTHKDRVQTFNSKLEALSEHHDLPKVGPG